MSAFSIATDLTPPRPDFAPRDTSLRPLAHWPEVADTLRSRGVSVRRVGEESTEEHENRLGTSLMALYRDTRREDAFEALYRLTGAGVQRWIRGLMHRGVAHLDPAELLQDTYVNVYRYPAGFREDHAGSFRVWVRTIAGNIVRRAAAPRGALSFQELPQGLQEPADGGVNPAGRVLLEEQERRLRGAWLLFLAHYVRAWEELSQRDRRTLHLVEVEGLSYEDAGDVLGVGRSNLKMIVFRARRRLARRIRQAMNAAIYAPLDEREAG